MPETETLAPDDVVTDVEQPAEQPDVFDTLADAYNDEEAGPETVDEEAPETPADAPAETPTPDAAVVAETPAEPAPEVVPFAFKAFNQEYHVPGLSFDPAKRAIVAEDDRALGRLKQMLSQGREWEARGKQELAQLRREKKQRDTELHPELEQAKVLMQEWQALMAMAPDDLYAFAQNAQVNWPLIQAKAERASAEALYRQAQQAQSGPEPDVESVIEDARNGAAELVQEILQDQPWASPELRDELTQYLQDTGTMNQWVARATRDLPEHGVRRGQYVALWDDARQLVDRYVKPHRDAHAKYASQQTEAAQKIQQTQTVAAQNAKVLAMAKPKASAAPPSVARPQAPPPKREGRDDIVKEAFEVWREMKRAR